MDISVIVPTFNEGPNVAELVRRTTDALLGRDVEIIFVDDSRDDTPDIIRAVAATSDVPVRLIHRDEPVGGLGGAVVEGIKAAVSDFCVVMDGDLQHPPEVIAELLARAEMGDADVVVASRYIAGGTSTASPTPCAPRCRGVHAAHEGDVPEEAAQLLRPDDGLLPRRPPPLEVETLQRAASRSCSRSSRASRCASPRYPSPSLPASPRVQGVVQPGHALPHPAHDAALRPHVGLRTRGRSRRPSPTC